MKCTDNFLDKNYIYILKIRFIIIFIFLFGRKKTFKWDGHAVLNKRTPLISFGQKMPNHVCH